MSDIQPRLLVTGASGQLGRRVLELLLEADAGTIIATTRSPEKLADFAEQGVIVRQADFDNPDSLTTAFEGVDRLLLISTDTVDGTDKRLNQHINAVKAAESAGVKHVVYTSLIEPIDSAVKFAPDHAGTEEALAESSLDWTILRNNVYMDMIPANINRAYQMGGLFSASGDGKVANVTREDCARAAAAALTSTFTGQRILNITGAEAYSSADIASIASEITGQPLNYVPVELEDIIKGMVGAGLPRPIAEIFASFNTATKQGQFQAVSNDFEELTGQKPTTLRDFLMQHKDDLVPA